MFILLIIQSKTRSKKGYEYTGFLSLYFFENFHFWKKKRTSLRYAYTYFLRQLTHHFHHYTTLIDGISIELLNFNPTVWEQIPELEFSVLTSVGSGEELGSRKAHYKGLDFVIEPRGKAKVKGSIHKFYNNGLNNANRFTYEDLQKTVSRLKAFGIEPEKTKLKSFELGLNLDTTACKIDNKTFLESILYCKGAERSDMEINGKMGLGYTYKTTNTKYKFYDKAEQSKVQAELLRVESKFTRMRAVESHKIYSLSDLLDKEKLTRLILDKYLKPIDETIFFEWEQIKTPRRLPTKYKSKFKDLRNPDWWIKDERSRKERYRNKLLLEKLINKYAKRNIKNILKDLIALELQAFTRTKKGHEYTEFESLNNWNNSDNAAKKGTNTQSIVRCDSHDQREGKKKKKYCLCCGADISHQKKESKYCSHNRKCRDKAYNLKISEKRKENKTKKEKEIINLIDKLGSQLKLTKTTNPNRKKTKGIPSRKTSIIVTINGTRKMYHGSAARFFLNEFEKKQMNH
ncbi:hypothetical protein L3049_14160 [Labilibaculum sp. DW002]|uniref:Uncharacterized protein n=1 Tax=Paralabilibaculum antarcticum TaxID=2912572 RepID=A0ABT5VUN9_9BACT|nr:hypothetical protein [Labilibaculum sp. DW002]MDE5419140.1 hypothetical protein [Labilibaculum sp. DW002]